MNLDYATLRIIWWVLLGVLLIGFAIMDGFDLGIGALLFSVSKTDAERRVVLNTVGPVWEGNQVWLILGGGAIFAAWPMIYAVSFSGFYFAMLLVLFGLILRPAGFKYRSKITHPTWQKLWDTALFLGGFLPALLFGVALGNVLQGVPFHFDDTLRSYYTGTLIGLLNPFALLCGVVSLLMLCMHGGIFLALKTEGAVAQRAKRCAYVCGISFVLLFILAGIWVAFGIQGFVLTSQPLTEAPSNPLNKTVMLQTGAWLANYHHYPWMQTAPILGCLGAILALLLTRIKCLRLAWWCSGLSILGVVSTVGVSMFPFLLPSSIAPEQSLLIWDSSSSKMTLNIMLIATIIFMPIILLYTSWVYRVLRGKVTQDYVEKNSKEVY